MKTFARSILLGLSMTLGASALPLNLNFAGTFESDWGTGAGPTAGSAYSIQANLNTDSMTLTSSSAGTAVYQGLASWSGTIGATTFAGTGLTSVTLRDNYAISHTQTIDWIEIVLPNHADLFGTGSESALLYADLRGLATSFSGVGISNLASIGALTTQRHLEIHEHLPSWGLTTEATMASVPEPKISDLF